MRCISGRAGSLAAAMLLLAGCAHDLDTASTFVRRTQYVKFEAVVHGWCSDTESSRLKAIQERLAQDKICPDARIIGLDRTVPLDRPGLACRPYDFYYSGACAHWDPPAPPDPPGT